VKATGAPQDARKPVRGRILSSDRSQLQGLKTYALSRVKGTLFKKAK
jgi:hypothetical protein